MFPKPKRLVDKTVKKEVSHLPCMVCGRVATPKEPNDPHHFKTVGARGDDTKENLLSLCRKHHVEIHAIGRWTFLERYPVLKLKLKFP